jgi:hypothetical protein
MVLYFTSLLKKIYIHMYIEVLIMKKSLFRNRKTHKKKVNNKYKHFSNLKGGMETGEASPSTPKHHTPTLTRKTPTRKTPTRKTPTRKTPTKHTPHSKKSIHIPPMTFKTLQSPTKNRKRKVPSIVDGIVYSLPPSHKTKMDKKYHLVCSIDLSEYENRPYPRSKSGYVFDSMLSLRNKPSSRETVNLFMLVNKTINGNVLYNNPHNDANDLADFTLECKDGREIVRQNGTKSYSGTSITCFAWDKNNPNHLFIMGRGTNMMREFNNCLLRKFDYTNPDNPNPTSAIKRFVNKADDIFKFAINPNPDMDEIVVLEYTPRQILFHIYKKSDLTHLRDFVCEELGKLIPSFIIDNTGNHLIVADADNGRIQVFQLSDGTYMRTIGPPPNINPSSVSRYKPSSLALGIMNHLIVTSHTTGCVEIFSYSDGHHIMTIQSSPDESPLGVTADENGNFFVFYKGPDTNIIKKFQNTILKYKFNRMI